MANRFVTPASMATFEKLTKVVFAKVAFGATGAPTLNVVQSKGVISITRASAGRYVITFGSSSNGALLKDTYVKRLDFGYHFDTTGTSAAPAAPLCYVAADATATANTCTITIQFTVAAGTATDPASGEIAYLAFAFGDSTAP
jgi:hypothetical protein